MALNFGNSFLRGIFPPRLGDDDVQFQQGNRKLAGKIVHDVGSETFSDTNVTQDVWVKQGSGITVSDLKEGHKVWCIATMEGATGAASTSVSARLTKDGSEIASQTVGATDAGDQSGMAVHSLDTATATSHKYQIECRGNGTGTNDISGGVLTVVALN